MLGPFWAKLEICTDFPCYHNGCMQILAIVSLNLMYASGRDSAKIRLLPHQQQLTYEEECAFGAEINRSDCVPGFKAVQFGEKSHAPLV